jgi:acetylxylan esterase
MPPLFTTCTYIYIYIYTYDVRQHKPKADIACNYSWHGTVDTTLRYANYQEALKEWSNVLGLSSSTQKQNTPQSSYTQTIYGSGSQTTAQLVGYSAAGVGHTVPVHESMDIAFFGIA